jgi:diacylglycerol O-acyltransferase / wax synthase
MVQLTTALDAGFLAAQDPDRQASMAMAAVAIVDGALPDFGRLKRILAERIQSIPRSTQVLRTHPFNPQWIDDPGFDLRHHLRRVAVARPGDDAELSRVIAQALERPLELDRPLWECWVIEGLKGNQWAILMKIHHYLADGISAAQVLTRLCDDADRETFAKHVAPKQDSLSEVETPSWADALWRASALAGTVTNTLAGAVWSAVRTSSTRPVTTMRRYGTVRIPLAAVEDVCRKFRVTTNDVALAAITEGFRTVLLRRGEQPRADSLRTLEKTDDQISAMLPYLPVEHDDPVQRLRTVHTRLNRPRQANQRQSAGILDLAANFMPPFALCAKAVQLVLSRLPQPGIVTLATSASGPRHRLGLMGKTVQRLLPIPPTASQLSSGVAVLSYGDELVFGITADYDAAPELEQLAVGIERELARLVALSDDSVLLFSKDRRRRASRAHPSGAQRGRPSGSAHARH